jgi:hypothetical protein
MSPWRRGMVVIASASRTEDPGFKSRQGVRVLGLYTHCSAVVKTQYALSLCVFEKNNCFKKIFFKENTMSTSAISLA